VLLTNLLVSLSQAERDSFFDLSSNRPADAENEIGQLALSIFETNAVAAGDRVGIFPRMARLNHGCSRAFNSVYSWREQEGVIVVHALKPVKNGSVRTSTTSLTFLFDIFLNQELLTTYTNTRRSRTERRFHSPANTIPFVLTNTSPKRFFAESLSLSMRLRSVLPS
jgi:hypothetical protein